MTKSRNHKTPTLQDGQKTRSRFRWLYWFKRGHLLALVFLVLSIVLAPVSVLPQTGTELKELPHGEDPLPRFSPAKNVGIISLDSLDEQGRVTAVSLQGVVNSRAARINVDTGSHARSNSQLLDLLRGEHGVMTTQITLEEGIEQFSPEISGLIIYRPESRETLNVASTLAGIRKGLLVSPEQAAMYGKRFGFPVIEDLRETPWRDLDGVELYRFALKHLLSRTNPSLLGYLSPDKLGPRDYLIASQAFIFYVEVGPFGRPGHLSLLREILDAVPANSVVMGWPRTVTGMEENFFLQETSSRGKVFIGVEETPNLSFFSAFEPNHGLQQSRSQESLKLEDKVYVAFAVPDGDNLDFLNGRMQEFWHHELRGSLPIAWSVSPALAEFAPIYLESLYREATLNDSFIAGPSGFGYVYPGLFPPNALPSFLTNTREAMQRADLRVAWLLNTYRGYEVSYSENLLEAYSSAVQPLGLLLDYGDRPTGYSYWMAGSTPVTRSVHFWGSLANLREKIRLDIESVSGPHFLVVTLHPYSKNMPQLTEAASAISSLAPDRVAFVHIEDLFLLLLKSFPEWAEREAQTARENPLARWLLESGLVPGDRFLDESRDELSNGDVREAAAKAFLAIQHYHSVVATSFLAILTMAPLAGLAVLLLLGPRSRRTQMPPQGLDHKRRLFLVMTSTALLVASTIVVIEANTWDYLAVLAALAALVLVEASRRYLYVKRGGTWTMIFALLGGGVLLLRWSAFGLVLIAPGVAFLLDRANSPDRSPLAWFGPVSLGAAIGLLVGPNPIWMMVLLVPMPLVAKWERSVRASEEIPSPALVTTRLYSVLLLSIPLILLSILWNPFFSVRLAWNIDGLLPATIAILVFSPILGIAAAARWKGPPPFLGGVALALFLLANWMDGFLIFALISVGLTAVAWAFYSMDYQVSTMGELRGPVCASVIVVIVALVRIQPVYFSVFIVSGPAILEYFFYHPLTLITLALALASVLAFVSARSGQENPVSPDSEKLGGYSTPHLKSGGDGQTPLSVIIPVRGHEPFLELAIASLVEPFSKNPLEILVVNQSKGSLDLTIPPEVGDILRHTDYPAVSHVWQENEEGKAGAMNQGAHLASSDVLLFMDSDVILEPGLLDEAMGLLRTCDIVSVPRLHTQLGWSILSESFVRILRFVTPWCCLMRRGTLEQYGWWRTDYLEDVDFWLRARENGCRVQFTARRVILKRRVSNEVRKTIHLLKHLVGHPHRHTRFLH